MPEDTRKSTIQFTYNDPGRTFDGTPYEASGKAVVQTSNVLKLLHRSILDTIIQARNAYMQRNLDLTGDVGIDKWEDSAEYKMLSSFLTTIERMQTRLSALYRATTYDPMNAPKE